MALSTAFAASDPAGSSASQARHSETMGSPLIIQETAQGASGCKEQRTGKKRSNEGHVGGCPAAISLLNSVSSGPAAPSPMARLQRAPLEVSLPNLQIRCLYKIPDFVRYAPSIGRQEVS